jgi:hypothetical protein
MSNPIASAPADLLLKAVVLYDDPNFVVYAETALRRIARRPGVDVQWEVLEWRVGLLTDPMRFDEFMTGSLDAHLVVLPGSYAHSLPANLLELLKAWAKRRTIPDAALAFIDANGNARYEQPLSSSLSAFVREHGLTLILSKSSALDGHGSALTARQSEPRFQLDSQMVASR